MLKRNQRGTTLLEVLVAATILSAGIVATFQCLGSISQAQRRALDSETMQRLALQEFDRLQIENSLTIGQSDGDFSDQGELRFVWHAERVATSVANLDTLRVEVGPVGDNYVHAAKIQGLISKPSQGSGS